MKKFISPILVFATVLVICCLALPYSIICKESFSLFLNTPDYFRVMFGGSLPVCNIIADFVTQFFRYRLIGPAIIAGIITLIFLLLRFSLSRFGIRLDSVCALIAGAVFFIVAKGKLQIGILVLLLSAAAAIVTLVVFKDRKAGDIILWDTLLVIPLLAAASIIICLDPAIRKNEDWSRIEYGSYAKDWNLVIETATPEKCETDRMMIPFALLAHNCKGELADKMFKYPVISEEDLTTEGVNSFQGYYFSAILNREYGCMNEAVHHLFQASCSLRHTTCFLALRELIAEYFQMGDYTLARKYCGILARSSSHKRYVDYYLKQMEGLEDATANSASESSVAAQISHNPVANIAVLTKEGLNSSMLVDRYLCHLLAQKDLTAFGASFSAVADYLEKVPRYYQEALAVLGMSKDKIDKEISALYASLALGEEAPQDTYWYYLNR